MKMAKLYIIVISCGTFFGLNAHTYRVTNKTPYTAHVKIGVGIEKKLTKTHTYDISTGASQEFHFGGFFEKKLCFSFLELTVKDNQGTFKKTYSSKNYFISKEAWAAGIGAGAGAIAGSVGGPGGMVTGATVGGVAGTAVAVTSTINKFCDNLNFEIHPSLDKKNRYAIVAK